MDEIVDTAFFSGIRAATRFYVVRHGQSVANARRVVQGLRDFPLDDCGRAQAAALGAWFKDKGIDTVLASPLVRAAETADILCAKLGLPRPELRQELREIDVGRFSGLDLDEAKDRFPEDFAAFERLSWEGVPDAERAADVYHRAVCAWSVLRDRALAGSRRIVCVSHGGLIQWLVRATFGTRTWMPLLPTGNCGIFELLVEPAPAHPGLEGGVKLFWERINFQGAGGAATVTPVF